MGMFEFLKKKGKEDNIESIPVNDGIISLSNIEIVQNMNKMDTYICVMNERQDMDNVILNEVGIAFELPEGRKDLISSLITAWHQERSNREMNKYDYTYIGDIKPGEDGNLYYYNEPPTKETMSIIEEQSKVRRQFLKRLEFAEVQYNAQKKIEQYKLEKKKENELENENKKTKQDRIRNAYFKTKRDNGLGFDLTNITNGKLLRMSGIKKAKSPIDGRYLYTGKIFEVERDDDVGFGEPIGTNIAFTVPSRLEDILEDVYNPQSQNIKNSLQNLLSNSYNIIDKEGLKNETVDLGGVLEDGRIVPNKEEYGISNGIINRIKQIGAVSIEDLRDNRADR